MRHPPHHLLRSGLLAASAVRPTRPRPACRLAHPPGRFHRARGPFLISVRDGTPMPSGNGPRPVRAVPDEQHAHP
ncbi:hypothetical protein SUDANB91_05960 [Streptomyces sp. SudanB91_2054]